MLQCPACKKMTAPDKLGNWFQCQQCEHWLCLYADSKTKTTWLQPGIRVNDKIYEITITQAASAPGSVATANAERSYSTSVSVPPQTLEAIQLERAEVKRNLNSAESELRRLAAQMSTNTSNTATIERINNEITKVKTNKESLLAREKDLLEQKNKLEAQKRERERTSIPPISNNTRAPAPRGNQGAAFGCSALLVAAALILFGIKVNVVWNVNALLWLTGITLVGGVIFLIGYNAD